MRRLRPYLATVARGLKVAALAVGSAIGMLEVAIAATGYGSYLVAQGYMGPMPAAGVGLVVGGGLSVLVHLIMDAAWIKREGGK